MWRFGVKTHIEDQTWSRIIYHRQKEHMLLAVFNMESYMKKIIFATLVNLTILVAHSFGQIPGGIDGYVVGMKSTSISKIATTEVLKIISKTLPGAAKNYLALIDGEPMLVGISSDPITLIAMGKETRVISGNLISFDGIDGECIVAFDGVDGESISVLKGAQPLKPLVSGTTFSELRSSLRRAAKGMLGLVIVRQI